MTGPDLAEPPAGAQPPTGAVFPRPGAKPARAASGAAEPGLGVYVHWPFCASRCPYCDFNAHVRHEPPDQARFARAFAREIAHMGALAPGRTVGSVFLGGGTPSLMEPGTVAAILDAVAGAWDVDGDCEVTLEANPTSVEAARFRGYRAAGVNRVSLGVQALDDAALAGLGRRHSAAEALLAVDTASGLFPRVSFDLIYARPHQRLGAWEDELRSALARGPSHLSLYQLTIEPGTAYAALFDAGKLAMPGEDEARAFYDLTQAVCEDAGLPAYEVSNHARPGEEGRHNLVYWRYGEYAGAGPGAHGRLVGPRGRAATATEREPEAWLALVEGQGHALVEETPLSREEQGDEFLLMGLRLREGVSPARYRAIAGRALDARRIDDLLAHGMLWRPAPDRLAVTREGMAVLDAVVADLAA